jgi:hypothetical protein
MVLSKPHLRQAQKRYPQPYDDSENIKRQIKNSFNIVEIY